MKSLALMIAATLACLAPPALAEDDEVAAAIVLACVDAKGELVSAEIAQSSNFPEIDAAALKVARAAKFSPGKNSMGTNSKSCIKFKVKFVLRDGEPVPAES